MSYAETPVRRGAGKKLHERFYSCAPGLRSGVPPPGKSPVGRGHLRVGLAMREGGVPLPLGSFGLKTFHLNDLAI